MNKNFFTVKQIAEKWGLNARTVQIMCSEGKIPRAMKFGRDWAIPEDAVRPTDRRFVDGLYTDYRKRTV